MTDTLHTEPERDQFKSESPIRAFTDWSTKGNYALGKGFRPSLQHVVPYLDAMERKEGWRLVQVLEAGTQTPSFLFRLEGGPSDEEVLRRFDRLDLTGTGIKPLEEHSALNPYPVLRRAATGIKTATGDMNRAINGTTWPTKRKDQFRAFASLIDTFVRDIEAEIEIAAPYVRRPDSGVMMERIPGEHLTYRITRPAEKIHWSHARWSGDIEHLRRLSLAPAAHKRFLNQEKVESLEHFWRTASVASVLRLIDFIDWWDRVSLADYITVPELTKVLGRVITDNDPAYSAVNFFSNPLGETFVPDGPADNAPERIVHPGPPATAPVTPPSWTDHGSGEDIPVEHHEEALRFIADKRGMDADRLVRDFMLYFKPENQPNQETHKTFYRQVQFVLPAANPMELKRLIDWFRSSKALRDTVAEQMRRDPVDVLEDIAEKIADKHGLGVDHESFDRAREVTSGREDDIIERVDLRGRVLDRAYAETGRRAGDSDDPINPKHYNGRECADIGERLSANGYQILKYCWRLGKKDDPCQELGKAIWYGESERALMSRMRMFRYVRPNTVDLKPEHKDRYLEDRIADQPTFTQNIARMLWAGYDQRGLQAILEAIAEHKFHLDCGRGLAI